MSKQPNAVVFPLMVESTLTGKAAVLRFLRESNLIEDEPTDLALVDAWEAWQEAVTSAEEFDEYAIRLVHSRLLSNLDPNIAGYFRDVDVRVGSAVCPAVELIWPMLHDLLDRPTPTTAENIQAWHVAFERIHPFLDGNGRVGRILMNLQRVDAGLPLLIIPASERHLYYEWFR